MKIDITETARNFDMYPSEAKKQWLEDTFEGISIDYSPADHGEEPESGKQVHEILTTIGGDNFEPF